MTDKLILMNNVRELRLSYNLTQLQLAERIGVSRNTISSIETGQFAPTAKLALIICMTFDLKFEDVFYFDVEK